MNRGLAKIINRDIQRQKENVERMTAALKTVAELALTYSLNANSNERDTAARFDEVARVAQEALRALQAEKIRSTLTAKG